MHWRGTSMWCTWRGLQGHSRGAGFDCEVVKDIPQMRNHRHGHQPRPCLRRPATYTAPSGLDSAGGCAVFDMIRRTLESLRTSCWTSIGACVLSTVIPHDH
jgi:hypothetical protein